jgi:hypothetical protein
MSGPIAEGKFVFTEEGLEQVEAKLDKVRQKANGLLSHLPKEFQKQLKEAGKAMAEEAKNILPATLNAAKDAMIAPAKSTFDQVLAEANRFRRESSRIAISTGQDLGEVSSKINATAKLTKEMPASVIEWGRSVRALTGDWKSAIGSMAAMKDVALALDVPIESLVGQSARLQNSFGMKSTEDVRRFFGVMNAQASATGTTFEKSARQFVSFMDSFGRMSSRGAGAFSGLSAAFAASSADPEQAQRNQAFGMGVLNTGVRQIEQRMRRAGKLKKGEYISDPNTGETDPDKYLDMFKFMQGDMVKYHGSKRRAIEVEAGDDLEMRRTVGGMLNVDLSKVKSLKDLSPQQLKAFEKYSGMSAGKRDAADVQKNIRDQEAGMSMLPGQDAAVSAGGGHAGLAMTAASGLFSQAVDRFGGAVSGLVGFVAKKVGTKAAASAAVRGGAKVLAKSVPVLGTAYGVLDADDAGAGSGVPKDAGARQSMMDSDRQWAIDHGIPVRDEATEGPQEVVFNKQSQDQAAQATAAAMANRVLRVRVEPSTEAPESKEPPP